ncbi:DUF4302 domain-containing protein [Myroides odoratus]|uniref:DUF4302 domain-containing protein n=1 Tax=Myroides odoratus TaxID=256 RepID=UPI0039B0D37C
MIKRIFSIGVLTFALSASVVSCKSDDNVFAESPFEREKAQKEELTKALNSSDKGWKFTYFTDDTGLGAFTFLMDFDENGKVTMISDFDDESYTPDVSEYEVQLRATTSLVFATGSWIHKLSDPTNSALRAARGFEGEFQFRYYGSDENTIFFRGTKDFKQELKFVKATQEDWDKFAERKATIGIISNEDIPVFRSIEVEKGGTVEKFDATFSPILRFYNFNEGVDQTLLPGLEGVGVGFTNEGIVLSPAIKIDGEAFESFVLEPVTNEFVSVNSGNTKVRIKNVARPDKWSNVYKNYMFSSAQTGIIFFKEDLLNTPSISQKAKNILSAADVQRIDIIFQNGVFIVVYDDNDSQIYQGNITDTGKSGQVTGGNWRAPSSVPQNIKDLHQALFGYGDILLKEQEYTIKYINKIVTLYCGGVVFDNYKG